jgi:hypothetical protein
MAHAMLIIGLLFGVMLSMTVALFAILRMDGRFGDNVRAALATALAWLTGRKRARSGMTIPCGNESEARIRGLQEEIKVMQRLAERERAERQSQVAAIAALEAERTALQGRIAGLEDKIDPQDSDTQRLRDDAHRLRAELSERCADLSRAKIEIRDLTNELDMAKTAGDLTSVTI